MQSTPNRAAEAYALSATQAAPIGPGLYVRVPDQQIAPRLRFAAEPAAAVQAVRQFGAVHVLRLQRGAAADPAAAEAAAEAIISATEQLSLLLRYAGAGSVVRSILILRIFAQGNFPAIMGSFLRHDFLFQRTVSDNTRIA